MRTTTSPPSLLGTYPTPRFAYGLTLTCEVRGEVVATGLTNAPIPWPVGKRPGGRGRGLVVCGGLAAAVRREAVAAVAYWWGVTAQTVTRWRGALGVGPYTEGKVTRLTFSWPSSLGSSVTASLTPRVKSTHYVRRL